MISRWRFADLGPVSKALLLLLFSLPLCADTLGFIEQKFSFIDFEKGQWERTTQIPCYTYSARQEGAVVEVLRIGTNSLVPFKARKNGTVTVCGSTAIFDEGFEAGAPILSKAAAK